MDIAHYHFSYMEAKEPCLTSLFINCKLLIKQTRFDQASGSLAEQAQVQAHRNLLQFLANLFTCAYIFFFYTWETKTVFGGLQQLTHLVQPTELDPLDTCAYIFAQNLSKCLQKPRLVYSSSHP